MSVVFVHIGLPKTGTTHLQDRLWRNRDLALGCGLLYPGNAISDHFHAAVHLQPDRYLDWVDPAFATTWPTLVAQIKAWPQTSLLSHELFATATRDQIGTLVDDLNFADEIHVIATVRDLAHQLPSVWQENVKNQREATFEEFLASVREQGPAVADRAPLGDDAVAEPFWEFQDYPRILADWAAVIGPERVHLVTVPSGREVPEDVLWQRFLRVLDVDPSALTVPVSSPNSSLSAAQSEFLRQLNHRLQPDNVEWRRYERVVKGQLIGEILFEAPRRRARGLDETQRAWVAGVADTMVDAVRVAGYDVVGDLEELQVSRCASDDAAPPSQREVLDVALDVITEIVKSAPLPRVGPGWQTRGMNVVRRTRRRMLGLRRSLTAD